MDKPKEITWPSQMSDEALVRHVKKEFLDDAIWREQQTGPGGYAECLRLYESTGQSADSSSDIPELPQVKEPIDDAISLAIGTPSETRLQLTEPMSPDTNEDHKKVVLDANYRSVEVADRHINTLLAFNQFQDLRNKALKHAGVFGSGWIFIEVQDGVDTRIQYAARRLVTKEASEWTDEDFALYETLRHFIRARFVDTRDVYCMRGVTSIFDDDMLRMSVFEKRSAKEMQALYPEKDIRPGRGRYYLDTHYPVSRDQHDTVGVLTVWQLEPAPVVKELGDPDNPDVRVDFNDYRMLRVRLAGDTLIDKKIFDGRTGPLCMPGVPYYLIESENHPYGFSLARALKIISDYINSMYTMNFEQARKSVSPQSFAILTSKLARHDNIEGMLDALRDGEPVQIEGAEDVEDIRQVLQSTGQLVSGLSPVIQQAIGQAENLMRRFAANPDRDAIARAESGRAKETEVVIADRTKTPMVDLIARSDERIKDIFKENVSCYHGKKMSVPIRSELGHVSPVTLNDEKSAIIPIDNPITGEPITHPSFVSAMNPFGFVFDEMKYKENNMQLEMKAQAEGRGILPVAWQSRLRMLAMMLESGAIRSARTMRELALPEEIRVKDDMNAEEDQAEQNQQIAQMAEMGVMPNQPATGGQQPMARNGEINNPQSVRDMKQDLAMGADNF